MTTWICVTCGVQYAESTAPPSGCGVCADERQFVPAGGQQWTTPAELAESHGTEVREEEPGLLGIGLEPSFAIGQRALLVRTAAGNVLWDCVSMIDDGARQRIEGFGGVDAVCVSHPHFYSAMVEVADAFDATIHLPSADHSWVARPSPRIRFFEERVEPVPGLTMMRIGGHFDGASLLHWPEGAGGRGAILTGDTITVVPAAGWVSFMWSYPNLLPLDAGTVEQIAARAATLDFDRIYGGWWGRVVSEDGAAVVQRSAERYVDRVRGRRPASAAVPPLTRPGPA